MASAESRPAHPSRWVPTLYFAEGLPFVTLATVSVLMYKSMGIPDAQIAFWTTLIMSPWTFKPLWGPFLEMFKTKKYFVVGTQFIGGIIFGLVALTLPLPGYFQYSLALFAIIAFDGATHDIAADGLYINALSRNDQARYVGWQGAAYNIARVFAQGGFVYLAGQLEQTVGITPAWMIVMVIFGCILILLSLYHARVLPSGGASANVRTTRETIKTLGDVFVSFFSKPGIIWGVLFIIFYRFAEGQAVKIVPLFLRASRDAGGLGMTTSEIGIAYGTAGAVAFILGSLAAGYFVGKKGLKKSLLVLCCFFNIPFAVYAFLAFAMPSNFLVICSAIVCEYFGYGFGFVGLTLFMMQQVAPGPYKMAHYAFATAIMNLGYMIPSMLSGYVSHALGYRHFFLWVLVATIPSFLVTLLVPIREIPEEAGDAAQSV